MFGRRRNAPFQPLGLRLQRFGRRVMRNYAPSDSGPIRPASAPAPAAWQQSANEPLLWRSPDANSAPAPQQAAPAPQPQAAPYVPEPVQAAPTPPAGGIGDEANDFNLLKILAAHESRRAPTPPAGIARKLAEATSSTASEDSGDGDPIQTSRRRSRAAFDYVKTDALRADMTPNELQNMQRTAAPKPAAIPAPSPAEDVSEATYTEIDHAGDIQRSADDSGMTDGNNADVTTADSSEDAGAPTDMLFAPPSDADAADISPTLSPNVQREIDPDVQRLLDNALEVTPSSGETAAPAPTQAPTGIQRQAAPRAVPSQSESAPTPTVESPRPASQPATPIQRDVADNAAFTPAPQETRIPTPGTPAISRTADPSAVPSNPAEGTFVTAQDTPTQSEPASEVQRLLDQATTVTPASSASSSRPETPIQRTATDAAPVPPSAAPIQPAQAAAGTPGSSTASTPNTQAAANTPIQRTTSTEPTANTPIQRTAEPAAPSVPRTSDPTAAPIQREHDPEIQRLLDQALTVTPASSSPTQADTSAPTASTPAAEPTTTSVSRTAETPASAHSAAQTPIQRTTEPASPTVPRKSDPTPIQRTAETPASAQSAPTQTPIQRTPETPASAQSAAQTPIQSEPASEVQRLLDQAMTVTPASSATTQADASTPAGTAIQRTPAAEPTLPAVPRTPDPTSTPIQRTPGTPASAQSAAGTPDTAAFSQTGAANTPIQRTASTEPAVQRTETSNTIEAPIQREHDPAVQRLLDQAMTVTPASSATTQTATPDAPATPSTPIQRTAEPTTRPAVQQSPMSGPADNIAFTPTSIQSDTPVQREHDPEVQRLLDQALSVNPSTSDEAPAAPTAPTSAAQSVQRPPTTDSNSSVQRSPETPKSAKSVRSQAAQSDTSVSASPASTGTDAPIQREMNPDVQRLLDQALTVTPATSAQAPQASAPASVSTPTTPIQRTASQSQAPASGPIDSGSFTPTTSTAQPSVQREIDSNVQNLLDQALSVTPNSSAAPETPAASIDHGRSTPSVQRTPETPAATNTPSVQRTSRDTNSNRANIQRTPADAAPSQPAAPGESVQRTLDPQVQSLLDQALSVNPSTSDEAPTTPAARPVASNTADTSVQRTARDTGSKQAAKPAIQRTADTAASSETPVQRTLDPQVQRMLDQAMGVTPASSASAPTTSQPAASTSPARPNLQRQAAPQQPAGDANVSPSVQSDPFNRTLDPAIQRRLEEAMRVSPSSSTVARSAKTPLPVESRRPFIPTPPTSADAAESTPTAGTPTASPVQRSAATPPAAPKQPTPAASTPAAPNTPQGPSSSLESDLLRWMGLPADTPVEGRLSRKPSDSVDALMRKAETSTARPSESSTPEPTSSESTAASNPMPASQPSEDMPSISPMGFRDLDDLQRAIVVDEVSSEVSSAAAAGEGGESSINDIAQRVLDILRTKLRLERERTRKF